MSTRVPLCSWSKRSALDPKSIIMSCKTDTASNAIKPRPLMSEPISFKIKALTADFEVNHFSQTWTAHSSVLNSKSANLAFGTFCSSLIRENTTESLATVLVDELPGSGVPLEPKLKVPNISAKGAVD